MVGQDGPGMDMATECSTGFKQGTFECRHPRQTVANDVSMFEAGGGDQVDARLATVMRRTMPRQVMLTTIGQQVSPLLGAQASPTVHFGWGHRFIPY